MTISIQTLSRDPEFLALPPDERRKAFADIEPDFAALPLQEQMRGVFEMTEGVALEETLWDKTKRIAGEVKEAALPVPGLIAAGYADAIGGVNQWVGENIVQPVVNLVDSDPTHTSNTFTEAARALREDAAAVQKGAQLEHQVEPHSIGANVRSALVSTGQQLPFMVAAIPAASSAGIQAAARIPLTAMASQSAAQSYGALRDAGVNPVPATIGAAATGAIEYATEKIPAEKFLEAVKLPLLKTLGKMAVGEIGGEEIATVTQDMIQKGYVKTDPRTGQLSPTQTGQELVDSINNYFQSGEAWQNMKDTFWTTIIQTGIMGGAAKVGNRLTQPVPQNEQGTPEKTNGTWFQGLKSRGEMMAASEPDAATIEPNLDDPFNQVPDEKPAGPLTRATQHLENLPIPASTIQVTPEGQAITPELQSPLQQSEYAALSPEEIEQAQQKLLEPVTTTRAVPVGEPYTPGLIIPEVLPPEPNRQTVQPIVMDAERPIQGEIAWTPNVPAEVQSWFNANTSSLLSGKRDAEAERFAYSYTGIKNAGKRAEIITALTGQETAKKEAGVQKLKQAVSHWVSGQMSQQPPLDLKPVPTTQEQPEGALSPELQTWTAEQIRGGNTTFMRQNRESAGQYQSRIEAEFRKKEVQGPSHEDTVLAGIEDPDRENLKAVRESAQFWERGSRENGRSNKTEIMPFLEDWGDTTPVEVSRAIDNFMANKPLGEVQKRLIVAAVEHGRSKPQGNGAAAGSSEDFTLFDVTSVVPLALQQLSKIGGNVKEALPVLVDIGRAVHAKGATTYQQFVKEMRTTLGDLWNDFKGVMLNVYHKVRALNDRIGEKGAIGEDLSAANDHDPANDSQPPEKGPIDLPKFHEAVENVDVNGFMRNVGQLLNPLDWSHLKKTIDHHTTARQRNTIGALLALPQAQSERIPAFAPFYETAKQREIERAQLFLDFFGVDNSALPKDKDLIQRLWEFATSWDSGEITTKWGEIRKEEKALSEKQRDTLQLIFTEGDVYGRRYKNLESALINNRLKVAKLDQQTFDLYSKIREFIDGHVHERIEAAMTRFFTEAGLEKKSIDRHIQRWRQHRANRTGWMPRDHGEGNKRVAIYHVINTLDLDVDQVKGKDGDNMHRVRLPYYPGPEIIKQLKVIIGNHGGRYHKTPSNQPIMFFKDDPAKALADMKKIPLTHDGKPVRVLVYAHYVETDAQAEAHEKEIRKDFAKAMPHNFRKGQEYVTDIRHSDKIPESIHRGLSSDIATESVITAGAQKALTAGRINREEHETVLSEITRSTAEAIMSRAAGKYQIRRAPYLIEGYITNNLLEQYQSYMTGVAGMLSKAAYAKEQLENYRKAPPEVKELASEYINDSLRNLDEMDRRSGNVRALISFFFMGFKPASALINSLQVWTFGVANLGDHTSSPVINLMKAQRDIATGKLSQEEREVFKTAIVLNEEKQSQMAEIAGYGETTRGKWGKGIQALIGKSMALFQNVEVWNRKTMILAAYRLFRNPERPKGVIDESALERAVKVNSKTNFDMGRHNLPKFARNPYGRLAYALGNYTWSTMNQVYNRATSGEKADMVAMLRLTGMFLLLGGLSAGPGWEFEKIMQKITGRSFKLDLQEWTHKHLKNMKVSAFNLGEYIDGFLWHGLPAAAGVNISNSIRLQVPVFTAWLNGETFLEAATGPAAGVVNRLSTSQKAYQAGDTWRSLESALPDFLYGISRALRLSSKGATTISGRPIRDEHGKKITYSAMDATKRAFGLQPLNQSKRTEIAMVQQEVERQWADDRKHLLEQYRNSDKEDRAAVVRKIMKWNRELRQSQVKGIVHPISQETMTRARTQNRGSNRNNLARMRAILD